MKINQNQSVSTSELSDAEDDERSDISKCGLFTVCDSLFLYVFRLLWLGRRSSLLYQRLTHLRTKSR